VNFSEELIVANPFKKILTGLVNLDTNPQRKASKVSFGGNKEIEGPRGDTLSECPVVAITEKSLVNRDGVFVRMAEIPPLELGPLSSNIPFILRQYDKALNSLPPTFKLQLTVLLEFHNPAADLAYFLERSHGFKESAAVPGTGPFHKQGYLALSNACESMNESLKQHFSNRYPVYSRLVFSIYHDPLGGLRRGLVIGSDGIPNKTVLDGVLSQTAQADQELDRSMGYLQEAFAQANLPLYPLNPGQMCQRVWTSLHPQAVGSAATDPYRIGEEIESGGRKFVIAPDEQEFTPGMDFLRLADLLVPDNIQYDETWFRVDDVYCSGYVIYDFKPDQAVPMNDLRMLPGGFAGTLFMEYAEPASTIKDLEKTGTQVDAERMIRSQMGQRGKASERAESRAIDNTLEDLEISSRPPIDIRFFIICTAPTLDQLTQRARQLENKLSVWRVRFFNARLAQRKLFQSLSPVGIIALSQKPRNMTADSLSTFFWPRGTRIRENNGYYFGIDRDSDTPIYYDPFGFVSERNPSFLLLGSPGSGKSVATRTYIMAARANGARVFAFDPEGEMNDLCEKLGGRYIELGRVGGETINPAEIFPDEEDPRRFSAEHLSNFTQTIINRDIPQGEEFNALAHASLLTLLDRKWLEKVGDRYVKPKNFKYDPVEAPRLSDIWSVLKAESKDYPAGVSLASALEQYARPEGIYSSYFNQPTSFDVANENLVVFGFQRLNTDQEDSLRVYLWQAMGFVWNELLRGHEANPDRATFVFMDEVWKMIKNTKDPSKPSIGGQAIDNFGKRARKRRGCLFMATQHAGDFLLDPIGHNIFSNVEHLFMLGMTDQMVSRFKGELGLSDYYANMLPRMENGCGLFRFRDSLRHVYIMVPPEWGPLTANLYGRKNVEAR
jgi:hypothetical protein